MDVVPAHPSQAAGLHDQRPCGGRRTVDHEFRHVVLRDGSQQAFGLDLDRVALICANEEVARL